jgi:TRAP-type uncharacterized transport system substrate-binding protein
MTGPQGGSRYPLGGAIFNIADRIGIQVQVLPGAVNVLGVDRSWADMVFDNSISIVDDVAGCASFDKPTKNVCNVATLYL